MKIRNKLIFFTLAITFVSSCSIFLEKTAVDPNTIRMTQSGSVIGLDNGKTYQWLGIQYGSIPNANFRWKKAKQPTPWEGIKEAIKFGDFCFINS